MQSDLITNIMGSVSGTGLASHPEKRSGSIDFTDPYDNLYAFGKIWSGYGEPIIGCFHGLMYARIGDKRMIPLFGYTGTGVTQAKIDSGGNLHLRSRETGYFTDLESGDILEYWDNPFTGERVPVYYFYNGLVSGIIGPEMPKFLMDSTSSPTLMNEGTAFPDATGKYPFRMPFHTFGSDVMLSWDYTHEYNNPVTPEGWPKSSTGPKISPSEHFTIQVKAHELHDRDLPTCRMTAGFTRVSQFWPFMRMGGHEYADGVLFGRSFSHNGLPGYGDIPRKLLDYIEKHAPEYLTLPANEWAPTMARIDTWKTYAKDIKPENPAYTGYKPDDFTPPTGSGANI